MKKRFVRLLIGAASLCFAGCFTPEAVRSAAAPAVADLCRLACRESLDLKNQDELRRMAGNLNRRDEYLAQLSEYASDRRWMAQATVRNDPRFAYGIDAILYARLVLNRRRNENMETCARGFTRCILEFEVKCAASDLRNP